MNIAAISKIILLVSLGLYGFHVLLVIRRILCHASYLAADRSHPTDGRLLKNGNGSHKIVNLVFEFDGELLHEEGEEKG
jgi:hypothetical protein